MSNTLFLFSSIPCSNLILTNYSLFKEYHDGLAATSPLGEGQVRSGLPYLEPIGDQSQSHFPQISDCVIPTT